MDTTLDTAEECFHSRPSFTTASLYRVTARQYLLDEMIEHDEFAAISAETMPFLMPPVSFDYQPWRHGGWYVSNVRYPSGAVGCVSRNYQDRKWRIVCDPRPEETRPTFKSRDDAALAEWKLIHETPELLDDYEKQHVRQPR